MSNKIDLQSWNEFQNSRAIPFKDKIISCYAPFNHLRIRRDGGLQPCCFFGHNEKWVNGKFSLKDYWFGEESLNASVQESMFEKQTMHHGCNPTCGNRIANNIQPPVNEYDWNVGDERLEHAMDPDSWPKVVEWEISNLCNMACPMCFGYLSSKHMLGRDKHLGPWPENVFDDDDNMNQILEELEEFVPHLKEFRFVGGEPFAHKAFYSICEIISNLNPNIEVQVCTNGSVYNKKVEKICKENNLKLSISLDTVMPEEYPIIRVGGTHKQTFSNVEKFKKQIGSDNITINAVLLNINAENIDQFFKFAIDNEFKCFINQYHRRSREHTEDLSHELLGKEKIQSIINKIRHYWTNDVPKPHEVFGEWPEYLQDAQKAIDKCIALLENDKNLHNLI